MLVKGPLAELFNQLQAAALGQELAALGIESGAAVQPFVLERLPIDDGLVAECSERGQIGRRQSELGRELLLDGDGIGREAREFFLGIGNRSQASTELVLFQAADALLPLQDPLQAESKTAHRDQSLAVMARSRPQVSSKADFSEVCWRRNAMISG